MTLRRPLVCLHRWVSIGTGLLLALLGLTGSLLVWQAELDAALNPAWFAPRPACAAPQAGEPIARSLALLASEAPGRKAALVVAPATPGAAYQVWERRDPASETRREHFIDPACGLYLGHRDRGALRLDAAHAIPALYELHRNLLTGERGHTVAGIGGLLLFGLGVSGVYLAWPRSFSRAAWGRVLGIKRGASRVRLWFDVHRAVGMWLAPLLLLMSLTGSALVFNEVARSAVAAVLPVEKLARMSREPAGAAAASPDLDELVKLAERQFPQAQWSRLTLPSGRGGVTEVRLLQPGEPRIDTGNSRVRFDATGTVQARVDPLQAPAGNVVLDWIFPLHSGEALGLAARCLWSVFGLVPALLLGSGFWLWWRRR